MRGLGEVKGERDIIINEQLHARLLTVIGVSCGSTSVAPIRKLTADSFTAQTGITPQELESGGNTADYKKVSLIIITCLTTHPTLNFVTQLVKDVA